MKRCVIIGGAEIKNYDIAKRAFMCDDFVIYCDGGLNHMEKLEAEPNLIVGDFDSHTNPNLPVETIVLPCEKDDTDTVFALKEGIKRGCTDFIFVGVIGQRLDHTLGNVSMLLKLDSMDLGGKVIDDYSEMEIVSGKTKYIPDSFKYFSLLNISGTAKGINIRNAKYPLCDGEITAEYQYGVSNEVLPGKTAEVEVNEGRLLLIKVYGDKADAK